MATITRKDNTEFIAQPYREQLNIRSYSILKREVQHLAQINGQFIRLFKLSNGNYEAVFSHDPGFLLGESIWHYFGKPDNLVYCEEFNDDEVILVIIRNGSVFLDGKYLKSAVKDELSMLANAKKRNAFIMKTFGDVPLVVGIDHPDKFSFTKSQIRSVVQLKESIFDKLQVNAHLQLLSIEQALLEHRSNLPMITALIMATVVIIGGFVFYNKNLNEEKGQQKPIDPYLNFRVALSTPSPTIQLQTLAKDITESYSMPGWVATKIDSSGRTAQLQLHSLGGNLKQLFQWAQAEDTQINLGPSGALLEINSPYVNRKSPRTIVNTKLVTAHVIDSMLQILPGRTVKINKFKNFGVFKESELTVLVSNITPSILSLIGIQFEGLPIKLEKVSLDVNQGLLTGTIKIAILGN